MLVLDVLDPFVAFPGRVSMRDGREASSSEVYQDGCCNFATVVEVASTTSCWAVGGLMDAREAAD